MTASRDYVLYDYWRSSAAYRLRIALNLLGLDWRSEQVNLLTGAHRGAAYRQHNPQGRVPTLSVDGIDLIQSLASIEYLNETVPGATLLPDDPLGRHRVRALSDVIAMEIHPVCNLGVVAHVVEIAGGGEETKVAWMRRFITDGLQAVEILLEDKQTGSFCHGDTPTMADCCLIPQLYNAHRWGADLAGMPRIDEIVTACAALPAFIAAHPDAVGPPADG